MVTPTIIKTTIFSTHTPTCLSCERNTEKESFSCFLFSQSVNPFPSLVCGRAGSVRGAESWLRAQPSSCPLTTVHRSQPGLERWDGRAQSAEPAHAGLHLSPGQERVPHCHKYIVTMPAMPAAPSVPLPS